MPRPAWLCGLLLDWGGKFVGHTKDRWAKIYFELPDDDPVIEKFAQLGSFPSSHFKLFEEDLHDDLKPFETFTCRPYIKDADDPYTLPELRWKYYSSKKTARMRISHPQEEL